MLACARIGAIHNVVFGGLSVASIVSRVNDSMCKMIITQDIGFRTTNVLPMYTNVEKAQLDCPSLEKIVIVNRGNDLSIKNKAEKNNIATY